MVEERRWQPMSREQFLQLRRLQRLRDRGGRIWTVYAEPFEAEGEPHVIIRSGDLVRRVPEHFADDYQLQEEPE